MRVALGTNNPFDERVGHWGVRNRFDLSHFQYSQVGLPAAFSITEIKTE